MSILLSHTWLAGKIKCGKCGYALKTTLNPSGYEYLRCSKWANPKGCPGCGTLRKNESEQFIFTAMGEKFREFKLLWGGEGKVNPKITAYQVELAQVEAEIEELFDTLTGASATLLASLLVIGKTSFRNSIIQDAGHCAQRLSEKIIQAHAAAVVPVPLERPAAHPHSALRSHIPAPRSWRPYTPQGAVPFLL